LLLSIEIGYFREIYFVGESAFLNDNKNLTRKSLVRKETILIIVDFDLILNLSAEMYDWIHKTKLTTSHTHVLHPT